MVAGGGQKRGSQTGLVMQIDPSFHRLPETNVLMADLSTVQFFK